MSTEPRRIRRIIRRLPVPKGEVGATPVKPQQRQHVYAISKPRITEGFVTLPQLAAERGIQAQLARLWLKRAKIQKPRDGWWRWEIGSQALKRVRRALGL